VKPFQAIAAMSLNRVIGAGNKIPWHLPEDFKWFKATTTGHVIVMGRKTFESIGKPLPNRTTIVLSRSAWSHPGVITLRDLPELLAWAKSPSPVLRTPSPPLGERDVVRGTPGEQQVFICGGAQIYAQVLPLCSDLFLTLVKREVAGGDAFFPPFEDKFELVEEIRDTPEFKILHYRQVSPKSKV
jgi:dihydrofolate reductase